jgi:hypothetical protein
MAQAGCAWDLRKLTDSHSRYACTMPSFAVDEEFRYLALSAGRHPATLPQGAAVSVEVQDFLKALTSQRCQSGLNPIKTRSLFQGWGRFFSTTTKCPWELTSEDVDQFLDLEFDGRRSTTGALAYLVRVLRENLLSAHGLVDFNNEREAVAEAIEATLTTRVAEEKLPDREALYELCRIVFNEQPTRHSDLVRFCILRIILLTGLRIGEVLMLPRDCLRYDVYEGASSGERCPNALGEANQVLRLRYFGEKQLESAPDVLVDTSKPVPRQFMEMVADTVKLMQDATEPLRRTLVAQHATPAQYPGSDLRTFRTTDGGSVATSDLLFLVMHKSMSHLPATIKPDARIGLISTSAVYLGLGLGGARRSDQTIFSRYRRTEHATSMWLRPHSLRHLMNAELHRQGVSDLVVTLLFGRQDVEQTHAYYHPTGAEHLKSISLPPLAATNIKRGSLQETIAKLVVGSLLPQSSLERNFKSIQSRQGDAAAFRYLAAASEGVHPSPFGLCLSNFQANPCSRHLSCLADCASFVASGRPEHIAALQETQEQLSTLLAKAEAMPSSSVGRTNQIAHIKRRQEGIAKTLASQPGAPVFPQGTDHSTPKKDVFQ